MEMTVLMLALWQGQGSQYKTAFDSCTQAYYQGSEFKSLVDSATEKAKKEYPLVAGVTPMMYAVGVKKEIRLVTSRISIIPNTRTSYQYNHNAHQGSVGISWSF